MIIDWIDATSGNSLADLARSTVIFGMSPVQGGAARRWLLERFRTQFQWTYLERYRQQPGWNPDEFAAWRIVNAAARIEEEVPEAEALLDFVTESFSS